MVLKNYFRSLVPEAGSSSSSSRTPRKMASLARSLRLVSRVRPATVVSVVPRAATAACLHTLGVREHSAGDRVLAAAVKVSGAAGSVPAPACVYISGSADEWLHGALGTLRRPARHPGHGLRRGVCVACMD